MLDLCEAVWSILELSPPWHTIWPQCARVGHVALRERERGKESEALHPHSEGNMQSAVTVDRSI